LKRYRDLLLSVCVGSIKEFNVPEFAAEKTNTKTQALKIPGRAWIPLIWMATTNGLAAAEVVAVAVLSNSGELYGTIIPRRKTSRT
jgi:hypothetical protein